MANSDEHPGDPKFWDVRYREKRTRWDLGKSPAALVEYLQRATPGRALVPGCGAGYELRALLAAGWEVTGIEFSRGAIDSACETLGPLVERVVEGDFFAYPFSQNSFDLICERAFLCAIPRERREDWGKRVASLLPSGGRLVGCFFYGEDPVGPPYPLGPGEIERLLAADFTLVEDALTEDALPFFAGGERWQVWQRR
jgi:SAM-dependent methyltransferase